MVAILAILVLAVLAFGGWYVWQKNKKSEGSKTSTQTNSDSNQNKETPKSTDPYDGWKAYTASSFSFRYPANWSLTDRTAGSNEELALTLQSPEASYGVFEVDFDLGKSSPSVYTSDTNVKELANTFRVWTKKMSVNAKGYNNAQPFDCARLRLLDPAHDTDVLFSAGTYLSSQAGFCMNQNSYTTKSYDEQLASTEVQVAIKVYESIQVSN
jgi:hypothetical protein